MQKLFPCGPAISRPEVRDAGNDGHGTFTTKDFIAHLAAGIEGLSIVQANGNESILMVNDLNDIIDIDHPIFNNNKTTHNCFLFFFNYMAKHIGDAGPEPWPLLRAGI